MVFVFIIGILFCTERQARRESVGGLGLGEKYPTRAYVSVIFGASSRTIAVLKWDKIARKRAPRPSASPIWEYISPQRPHATSISADALFRSFRRRLDTATSCIEAIAGEGVAQPASRDIGSHLGWLRSSITTILRRATSCRAPEICLSCGMRQRPLRDVLAQLTLNQRVPISSPGAPTNKIKDLARKPRSCVFPSNVGATCWATRIFADQSFLVR